MHSREASQPLPEAEDPEADYLKQIPDAQVCALQAAGCLCPCPAHTPPTGSWQYSLGGGVMLWHWELCHAALVCDCWLAGCP